MKFSFSDDQKMLRGSVRDVLAFECTPDVVRAAWNGDTSQTDAVWSTLAELGVVGMCAPEAQGGLDMNELDLVLSLEEMGAVAFVGAIVDTAAVAVPLLSNALQASSGANGSSDVDVAAVESLLARAAAGELRVGVSLEPHALVAHHASLDGVVALRDGELRWYEASDVTWSAQVSVDRTRDVAHVASLGAAGGAASSNGVLLASAANAARLADRASLRGAVATAAMLVGLSRAMIHMSVEYAQAREQFGKPIGAQQAVKHRLANAFIENEFARPMVHRAAWELAQLSPVGSHAGTGTGADAVTDEVRVAVSAAKLRASESAAFVAKQCLQVHGAIGYTTECDLHFWMKRVWALGAAYGTERDHLRVVREFLTANAEPRVASSARRAYA